MTPPVRFQQTVVFGDGEGGGNPCPVVFGAQHWSAEQMRALAAHFGEETGFVLAPKSGGDVRLRYFVPHHEMEMCVHATVAATVVHGRAGGLPTGTAVVETPLGRRQVEWDGDDASATVDMFEPRFEAALTDPEPVLRALGIERQQLGTSVGPVQSVSMARAKLMVPLRDEQVLDSLAPDFEALWAVCEELGVTGFYPFAVGAARADAAARQFPLRAGYDEDAATGVAAGALGAYLTRYASEHPADGWSSWTVAQGRALGRPSLMRAKVLVEGGKFTGGRVGGTMASIGERQPVPVKEL